MSINLGIMQSRLSPLDLSKTYQCWPEMNWEAEFALARQHHFDHIEIIYDSNPNNILNQPDGYKKVLKCIMDNMVDVESICADYFIDHPFWLDSSGIKVLNNLIQQAYLLGAKNIVIPCLDNSSFNSEQYGGGEFLREIAFMRNIRPCIEMAERYMINLCLESDLHCTGIQRFMRHFTSTNRFGICLDTGNIASLGENPLDHLKWYGNSIKHIHLKDSAKGQKNMEMGTGQVDFAMLLYFFRMCGYQGVYTFQCARKEFDLDFIDKQYMYLRSQDGKI